MLDVFVNAFQSLGEAGILILLIVFLVVVLSLHKIFSAAKGVVPAILHFAKMLLAVCVASALFPVFAGRLLGLPVAVNASSMIFFITVGITLYILYLFAKGVYKGMGFFESHMPKLPKHRKKEKFDYEKQLKEGKKKLHKELNEERKAISSDGDTSKFVKKQKTDARSASSRSHVTPLKDISFDDLGKKDD